MIEKERVKQLAQEKYQEAIRGLEDDLLDIEDEPNEAERKLLAEGARKNFGRRIINTLYGIAGGGNPEFKSAWDSADAAEKKKIAEAIKEFLIEVYPILDTEGVIAANATHIIGEIAAEPELENERVVTVSYEALTPEEIASLPEKVREELSAFLELHGYLVGYDAASGDELEALKDLIEESLSKTPKTDIIKFLLKLELSLGGLGKVDKTKLKNFLNGVINKAKAILAPPVGATVRVINNAGGTTDLLQSPNSGEVFSYPEISDGHMDANGYMRFFDQGFRLRYEKEGGVVAAQYLIDLVEPTLMDYFASNGGMNGAHEALLGLFKVLKHFGKSSIEQADFARKNPEAYGLQDILSENVALHGQLIEQLKRKATETICIMYIDHIALKMGNHNYTSMTSDWEKVVALDAEDRDFGIGTYDSMLQESETSYEYASILNWVMWKMPDFIRDFGPRYDDKHEKSRDQFEDWLINENSSDQSSGQVIKMLRAVASGTPMPPIDGKTLNISQQKAQKLLDAFENKSSSDLKILMRTSASISTSLGVRQNTFRIDLARGATPALGLAEQKRWMIAVCPYAHFNYKCYKEYAPHLTAEGFDMDLGAPVSGKEDDLSIDEKIVNMRGSMVLTKAVLESVQPLRRVIHVGDTRSKDQFGVSRVPQVDNIYPDLYTFVVREFDQRKYEPSGSKAKSEAAAFASWMAGLLAIENFVQKALSPPLGTSDREQIRSKDPASARKEMLKSLASLVHDVVSPLKSNTAWVRWDHIAQFILIYVDKMIRNYRLIDDSESGTAIFIREIREKVETSMANLAKLAESDPRLLEIKRQDEIREGRQEGLATATNRASTFENKAPSILSASDFGFGNVRPDQIKQRKWDLRDYVLNRMARATGYTLVPATMNLNYAIIDGNDSIGRARSAVRGGVDGLIRRGSPAFRIEKSKIFDKLKLEGFYEASDRVLFGTQTDEQKKTADDKK